MNAGHILFLNGPSSAGKTTLAKELQNVLDEPYLYVAVDTFCGMKPARFWGVDAFLYIPDDPFYKSPPPIDMPPATLALLQERVFPQLIQGYHRAIGALASAGNNVIVDHVLQIPRWLEDCVRVLSPYQVHFIGVHCSLQELEHRETQRGDRPVGMARFHFDRVHAHGLYDLVVNTEDDRPERCALKIRRYLQSDPVPSVFAQLRKKDNGRKHPLAL